MLTSHAVHIRDEGSSTHIWPSQPSGMVLIAAAPTVLTYRAGAAQALVESNLIPVGSGEASRTCCQHRNGTLGQPALALVSKKAPHSCAVAGSQPCCDASVDLETYSRCALNSPLGRPHEDAGPSDVGQGRSRGRGRLAVPRGLRYGPQPVRTTLIGETMSRKFKEITWLVATLAFMGGVVGREDLTRFLMKRPTSASGRSPKTT